MGWFGRGIGDFGSQVGQGYDINLGWKERLQNMALQNARQKLADVMGPLQVQEIQQRLRQMQAPQPAGIEKGSTGGLSGVKWNPKTGQYELQELAPGGPANTKITTPFEMWRASNPNSPIEDWFKVSRAPAKPEEIKDAFELWRSQNPGAPIAEWFKLQEKYKKSEKEPKTPSEYDQRITNYLAANKMQDTPANRDKADQALGVRNKQNDRVDATKAVTAVLNAQKSLQALEARIQIANKAFSIWNPKTWGSDPALNAVAQQAVDNYNGLRQDAQEKLTDAGMPVPAYLLPAGSAPPPPAGFHK